MKKQIISSIFSLVFLVQIWALSAPVIHAQVPVLPPKVNGRPVEVESGVYIEEIQDIKEGDNSYLIKGYLDLAWRDERLKFPKTSQRDEAKIYLENGANLRLQQIWWPDVEFTNELKPRERLNEELLVFADGRVNYRERFNVQLSSNFGMKEFPFDTQYLLMHLESFAWNRDDLLLKKKPELLGFSHEFKLPGWNIQKITASVRDHKEPRDRAVFSEMEAVITIRRDPGFFLWKFMIPLAVVMVLVSSVLWIPPHEIKERVSATLMGILTSTAYGFIIAPYLPAHVYDTYIDKVVMISLLYAAGLMVMNVYSYQVYLKDREAQSLKVDKICRIVFPIGFLILILLAKLF